MITEVSQTLRDVIHRATPDLGSWVVLHSLSQSDDALPDAKAVIALIAIEEHPHLRNLPLVEAAGGALVRPPLALRLHYLITYYGPHDEAQTRLGRIIQAFHTTPIVRAPDLLPTLATMVDSIVIRMEAPTPDERNQIWACLGRPGRVCLYYEVEVAPVPVLDAEGASRVLKHQVRGVP